MEERLKRLLALHAQATEDLKKLEAQRQAITDIVREEGREDLTVEEDADFRTKTAEIKAKQGEIDAYDERIKELSEEIERAGKLSESATAIKRAQSRIQSVKEAVAYEKGNGASYFRDMMRVARQMDVDGEAQERLRRHGVDVKTAKEYRDLNRTDGTGGYAVPPAWLMDQYVDLARAGRAYANIVNSQPLPGGTDSINIPKLATGTSTGVQTADNAAVTKVDITDTSVQANVKTIAGQEDVAIQLLDQSPINFDEVIFRDLIADYATKLDLQVISGSNGSGQVQGIRGTSGISTITATSVTDNVGLLFAKVADAVQRVHTLRYLPPTAIVMHPRRWAFFLAARDTSGRPLVVPNGGAFNQIGELTSIASQQVVGNMHGLPVITDPNLPTTDGAGTNQDVIHVLRASDLWLYESAIRTRVMPEVLSNNLTVRLQVYGYIAFTAGRFPQSVVEIAGTALTPPTFT